MPLSLQNDFNDEKKLLEKLNEEEGVEIQLKSTFTLNFKRQKKYLEKKNSKDERKIILIVDDHKYIREA